MDTILDAYILFNLFFNQNSKKYISRVGFHKVIFPSNENYKIELRKPN